jgi:tetratricopeptide (TPR) repeat protein
MVELGTEDSRAFALAHEGATLLENYRKTQDVALLDLAETHLREALGRDPGFAFALFTHAVAAEYLGNHALAIDELRRLQRQRPDYEPEKVTYNLATSNLTTYTDTGYTEAEKLYGELARKSASREMRALAEASLAMLAAQRLVAAVDAGQDAGVEQQAEELQKHADIAEPVLRQSFEDWRLQEARWLLANARGVAKLYEGDHLRKRSIEPKTVEARFKEAEEHFGAALRSSPANADVLANLGTLWLTRWRVSGQLASLDQAREFFTRVTKIRPRGDFAYYRLGQVERRAGNFPAAIAALEKARDVKEGYREVPREKIEEELERARFGDAHD